MMRPLPRIDRPQPGWYLARLVKRGPLVPARIWRFDGRFYAEVAGRAVDPLALWPRVAARPITEDEYHRLVAEAARCAPDEPAANPTKPVNLAALPAVF
jgi:hypothetical protein